jgi:hypothetical protein
MQQRAWKPVIVSDDLNSRKNDIGGPSATNLHLGYPNELPLKTTTPEFEDDNRRGDLRFSVAVALAFALPAFLSFGFYAAVHSLLLMAASRS